MTQMPNQLPDNDPGLILSDAVQKHLTKLLQGKDLLGIRLGIKKAGCSGYEYVLEFAKESQLTAFDFVFRFDEFSVVIDKEIYLKFFKGGTQMDYSKEGINEGIKFDNPNVGHQCGCGESFTLVDEDEQ
ncbi:MAG: HesB/IscA family protein [Candidatus Berkiella sp.]